MSDCTLNENIIIIVVVIRSRENLEMMEENILLASEVAVVSSFIIFKKTCQDNCLDHIDYRKAPIMQLVREQRATRPTCHHGWPSALNALEQLDRQKLYCPVSH